VPYSALVASEGLVEQVGQL